MSYMNPVQIEIRKPVEPLKFRKWGPLEKNPENYNFYLISPTLNLTTTGFQFNFLDFVKLIEIPC